MSAIPNASPSPRSVATPSPRSSGRPGATQNPYAPPRARVRDVAAPRTGIVLAGRGARLGASIVDSLIVSAVFFLPMFTGLAVGAAGAQNGNRSAEVFLLGGFGLGLAGFVVWLWMTIRQMSATGQSLAKKYFNIKVVMSDGSPASLGTLIWKRNVINMLLGIIPFYGFIEVLFIFGEDRQCLHDKIADTIVVEA